LQWFRLACACEQAESVVATLKQAELCVSHSRVIES
jgi:hypothetical protein